MSKEEIREAFDRNPNLTVEHLARRTGKSRSEIVKILMESK